MTDNPNLSRRQFFKYATVGGLGTGALTYSPDSEAFVITAYAIYTGEQIGAYTKPIIDQLVDMVTEEFLDYMNSLMDFEVQAIAKTGDNVINAIKETDNSRTSRLVAPMPNICANYVYNQNSYERDVFSQSLKQTLNEKSNHNYKQLLSTRTDVDYLLGLAYSWNSFGDGDLTELNDKATVTQFYLQMAFINEDEHNFVSKNIGWNEIAPGILRRKLIRTVLNSHLTKVLTDYYRETVERIDTTYHSEEWRSYITSVANPVPLMKSLTIEKAFENKIQYEISLSKQKLLLLDCLKVLHNLIGKI